MAHLYLTQQDDSAIFSKGKLPFFAELNSTILNGFRCTEIMHEVNRIAQLPLKMDLKPSSAIYSLPNLILK
jgi:hypothetical protein